MITNRNEWFRVKVVFVLCTLSAVWTTPAQAQQLRILSSGPVSPGGSWSGSYDVEADPDDANNLIVCGPRWDAKDNANYGFVYSSQDAGKSWHVALEDKNSRWVTEQSCAFGVHGVAYFVSDSSRIDDAGELHHELGTTRIWVSRDAGRTWSLGTTGGWTDLSASVVDRTAGPNENRLYTFFNGPDWYYTSVGDKQALDRIPKMSEKDWASPVSSLGLISYREGDGKIRGPIFNPHYKRPYRSSYPGQNLMLKDGSLLALLWMRKGQEYVFVSQHSDSKRQKLSDPVVVNGYSQARGAPDVLCSSYTLGPAAYDSATNTVYAAYLDGASGKCKLTLNVSTDDGQTWLAHPWTETSDSIGRSAGSAEQNYASLAMARNQDGVLALLWRNNPRSDCWYFATSTDSGQTYSHPMQLSSCSAEEGKYRLSDAYLDFGYVEQAEDSRPADRARLSVKNDFNFGGSRPNGIAVSADGVFHPVWFTSKGGQGELHTAAIAAVKSRDQDTPEPERTDDWQYMTDKVKFLYGGSQHYDAAKSVLAESVILRNSGSVKLHSPLRLEIEPASSTGLIYPLDILTERSGQSVAQYLDVDQYVPGDGLNPGASSAPIPLNFHFELYNDAKPDDNILAHVSIRLLTKKVK